MKSAVPVSIAALLPAAIALICTCDRREVNPEPHPVLAGAITIAAQGRHSRLGSSDPAAESDEHPTMPVSFSYNYAIDTTEVTIASYRSLVGSLPPEYDSLGVADSLYPVTYVSWYDAVLYCNTRSKAARLDTVYRYVSISRTPSGAGYHFNGLVENLSAAGFRLPTEAEWVYAASGGDSVTYPWGSSSDPAVASEYAWFQTNSGGHLHSVATLRPNGFGLYDMAGNAMEWTNDDKGDLCSTPVNNYAGSEPGSTTQRALKGGSYTNTIDVLRISRRSDEYPTDAATRSRYIGFRCAAGVIPDPRYLSGCDVITDTLNPVYLEAGAVGAFFGTARAKLVFVNKTGPANSLCFIDWSAAIPAVHVYTDENAAYTPTISPDGQWVAWSSGPEGSAAPAGVRVRRLEASAPPAVMLPDSPACVPRWWVDTAAQDTFVIYSTTSIENDLADWRTGSTRMMRFSSGSFSGTAITVNTGGAYHDGRSADGRYLASGYVRLLMKDIDSGEERVIFTGPQNGKPAGDTSQVCNVSISPDLLYDNQVLFLDFGSNGLVSTLTQTSYGLHEYLFMADWNNRTIQWYSPPAGYRAWDCPEWSTQYRFAAASVQQAVTGHPAIYAIDLQGSNYLQLCSGTELVSPYLWVDKNTSDTALPADSVGLYDTPHLSGSQAFVAYKLTDFWTRCDSLEIVTLGSSVAATGIDPNQFKNHPRAYNLAVPPGDMATAIELIRNYVLPHCPRLKLVAMSLDMFMYVYPQGRGDTYDAFVNSTGYLYDKSHSFWSQGRPAGFLSAVRWARQTVQMSLPPSAIDSLGMFAADCNGWGPRPATMLFSPVTWDTTDPTYADNLARLEANVGEMQARGIPLLLVQFPFSPGYAGQLWFGPNGPPTPTAAEMFVVLARLCRQYPNLQVYDANLFGAHDYPDADAYNPGHLCSAGAAVLSARLDSVFSSILGQ